MFHSDFPVRPGCLFTFCTTTFHAKRQNYPEFGIQFFTRFEAVDNATGLRMSKAASPGFAERTLKPSRESSHPDPDSSEGPKLSTPTTDTVALPSNTWAGNAPLRTASPESLPPSPPPTSSKNWKGKAKAVDFDLTDQVPLQDITPLGTTTNVAPERGSPSAQYGSEPAREALVPGGDVVYPPATENTIEERKVNEVRWLLILLSGLDSPLVPNATFPTLTPRFIFSCLAQTLKRWEQLERQRRKAARESRSSVDTTRSSMSISRTSPPRAGDVQRRGSLFWSRSGAKARKPAPGSQPLPTGEGDAEAVEGDGHTVEDFGEPPESEDIAVVQSSSNDPRENFMQRQRHNTSSSVDSHISDSSAATITPESSGVRVEVTGPTPSNSSIDPFVDPSTPSSAKPFLARNSSVASDPFKDASTTYNDESLPSKRNSKRSSKIAQPQPQHPPTAGAQGMKRPPRYPTPQPLGLPVTAMVAPGDEHAPDHDDDGRSDTDSRSSSQQDHPSAVRRAERKQMVDGEHDEPPETGKWWTEWLCGCSEGPDRGGEHQVRI